jgi:hypothetical protein
MCSASGSGSFTLGTEHPVPIGQEAGWTSEPGLTPWSTEKSALTSNRTPAVQSVVRLYNDWAIPAPTSTQNNRKLYYTESSNKIVSVVKKWIILQAITLKHTNRHNSHSSNVCRYVRFQVRRGVNLKCTDFWNVTPWRLVVEVYERSGGTHCFHLQNIRVSRAWKQANRMKRQSCLLLDGVKSLKLVIFKFRYCIYLKRNATKNIRKLWSIFSVITCAKMDYLQWVSELRLVK